MKMLLVGLGFLMMIGFQNCGDMAAKSAAELSERSQSDFFAYPYATAPNFYGEIALYKASSTVSALTQFKFIGSAVSTDPTKAVSYVITVVSADGNSMCPTTSGTLAAGSTEVEFDCTSSVTSTVANVTMTLTSGAASSSITKSFKAN